MTDLANATGNGTSEFVIPPGVYRLADGALVISATTNFVLTAAGVELICEVDGSHFRLLNNKNLTIRGAGFYTLSSCSDPSRMLGTSLQCNLGHPSHAWRQMNGPAVVQCCMLYVPFWHQKCIRMMLLKH